MVTVDGLVSPAYAYDYVDLLQPPGLTSVSRRGVCSRAPARVRVAWQRRRAGVHRHDHSVSSTFSRRHRVILHRHGQRGAHRHAVHAIVVGVQQPVSDGRVAVDVSAATAAARRV